MHGCESWPLKKRDEERIVAFEMNELRRILRVSWRAKKSNEWVTEKAGLTRTAASRYLPYLKRKLSFWRYTTNKQ